MQFTVETDDDEEESKGWPRPPSSFRLVRETIAGVSRVVCVCA